MGLQECGIFQMVDYVGSIRCGLPEVFRAILPVLATMAQYCPPWVIDRCGGPQLLLSRAGS